MSDALPDPFSFLSVDKELACEFFAVFSRFEFALKESGYTHVFRGRPSPDWRQFAQDAALQLHADQPIAQAAEYLLTHPPQIQDENLKWVDRPLTAEGDASRCVEGMLRVRNNLFHGGKHPPYSPPGRDQQLVKSSLVLLYELLAQNSEVRACYQTDLC